MKRQFRILAGILSLVGCMAVFSGCKEETPPDPDAALKEDVLINGFEQWTPDLQTALIFNDFGKVSLNSDPAYVTQGERSVRLDPLGGHTPLRERPSSCSRSSRVPMDSITPI